MASHGFPIIPAKDYFKDPEKKGFVILDDKGNPLEGSFGELLIFDTVQEASNYIEKNFREKKHKKSPSIKM